MATSQGIESEFCSKMNNSIWYSEKTNERYHAVHEGDCPFAGTFVFYHIIENCNYKFIIYSSL